MSQDDTTNKIAAITNPTKAPIHTPTARRSHSRRHSGQPAMARLVDRRAARMPNPAHRAALVRIVASHLVDPVAIGNPKKARVGHDKTARTKPAIPRTEDCEPHNTRRLARPNTVIGTSAAPAPNVLTARA